MYTTGAGQLGRQPPCPSKKQPRSRESPPPGHWIAHAQHCLAAASEPAASVSSLAFGVLGPSMCAAAVLVGSASSAAASGMATTRAGAPSSNSCKQQGKDRSARGPAAASLRAGGGIIECGTHRQHVPRTLPASSASPGSSGSPAAPSSAAAATSSLAVACSAAAPGSAAPAAPSSPQPPAAPHSAASVAAAAPSAAASASAPAASWPPLPSCATSAAPSAAASAAAPAAASFSAASRAAAAATSAAAAHSAAPAAPPGPSTGSPRSFLMSCRSRIISSSCLRVSILEGLAGAAAPPPARRSPTRDPARCTPAARCAGAAAP